MITRLYKRNAQGKPLVWEAYKDNNSLIIRYGLVGGNLHKEIVPITMKKANELESRITAKRKEGYKELSELKDSSINLSGFGSDFDLDKDRLINYLNTYLPKYSTTSEGFILPMLAKTLEDNKPFDKYGAMLGQWKINGLRCIIGAKSDPYDMFNPIKLTYHSRTGENWTSNMTWMNEVLLPKISGELLEMMIEEGACLDGELYIPGYKVNDINSFVKNPTLPQHYLLQYWCYDICCENMSAFERNKLRVHNIDVEDKEMTKDEHLNNKSQFVVLPSLVVDSINEATIIRDNFISFGFEGLILRNPDAEYQFGKRNQSMFKYKKIDDGYFEIVNIKEDKRGLPIYTLRNDINDDLFDCTANYSQEAQKEQLQIKDLLIGKKAFVEFRERSGVKQVPFHAKIIKVMV